MLMYYLSRLNEGEMAAFKSKYRPRNPKKYINPKRINNLICRSSWERSVCIWCDNNTDVISWGLEEVVINYISKVDGKRHRYFVDFYIKFKNGSTYLVEVKPYYQTQEPDPSKIKTKKRLLQEASTYAVNTSKWLAAREFAVLNNAKFVIWTEKELSELGIQTVTTKKFRALKYSKKRKK